MIQKHVNFCTQRGEGRIGCIAGTLILAVLIALGVKIFPVYHSNTLFFDAVGDIANQAGTLDQATIESQIIEKAKEYNIPEAQEEGAISVSRVVSEESGMCTVRIKYVRKIHLYGITTLKMTTDKNIAKNLIVTGG